MKLRVLALTGMPASGKGAIAEHLKRLGYPVVAMGDVVRYHYMREVGGELHPDKVGEYAGRMREVYGPDVWARRTLEYLRERYPGGGVVVIDGIRSLAEVELFRRELGGDFLLVAVEAPEEVRFKRALERGRGDDIRTMEEFRRRDLRELSWGLGEVIGAADLRLDNSGHLDRALKDLFSSESVKKLLEVKVSEAFHRS